MNSIIPLRSARRPGSQACLHFPPCPDGLAGNRTAAKAVASYPEQGWSLLCNGVVLFDDGGALSPAAAA
ncbi:MAG TPA: DUF5999 family protein [Streptosporangiaceae bacterium]|jgi:hypothetical protein|nr:DUF5999 family protein [Streptosporangiaceae bacterium]